MTHYDWCHRERHTDDSLPCASPASEVHGITMWVTRGEDDVEAEVHGSGRLTNAQLADVIARLAEMEQLASRSQISSL